MSVESNPRQPASAHVVVLGGQSENAGKTTIAMHIAVALMNCGRRVATIDLDAQQRTLTRYLENRRSCATQPSDLALPTHLVSTGGSRLSLEDEAIEFFSIVDAIASIGPTHDVLVIDTPAADSDLIRFIHSLADTLITPIDGRVDADMLIDPAAAAPVVEASYVELVRGARQRRQRVDAGVIDWAVVRNRLSGAESRDARATVTSLDELAPQLGFRCIDGLAERAVYGELFARGLTALDRLDQAALGAPPTLAHVTAQREVIGLIEGLRLPTGGHSLRDAAGFPSPPIAPLDQHDLLET